jgi:nicotinamide phosphoribosyltransferase
MKDKYNLILDTDSYKASHWLQYPPGTDFMYSYFESRGGQYAQTVFFGLQYYLKAYLSRRITIDDVVEADKFFRMHGLPFNKEGWEYIAKNLGGRLPVLVKAVPEGLSVPIGNALFTVESTDPKVYWVVNWLETILMRMWYPITVATRSNYIKKSLREFVSKSSDNSNILEFMLHDFGSRGVSSSETAGIGGMSHLVNFQGSDTVMGVNFANEYYNSEMAGFSIPAAEHSTITSWGRDSEELAYKNMLNQFAKKGSTLAVVSDSYDLFNALENIWGESLKQQLTDSGATVVIRPDSGDPLKIINQTFDILENKFGFTLNSKGFKVLNNVRVIQGDGVNEKSIQEITNSLENKGFAADNISFGMGGALLQSLNRDTNKFAFKCSCVRVNGKFIDIHKEPLTDPNKKSKSGMLVLIKNKGEYQTVPINELELRTNYLEEVFRDGELLKEFNLNEIRKTLENEEQK